jgi:hypothetical protein
MAKKTQELPVTQTAPTQTSVVPHQGGEAALDAPAISSVAQAFMTDARGLREDFRWMPIISIDHDAGLFRLPSGATIDAIAGYPIYLFQTQKFYKKAYQAGQNGEPPDCWSSDCIEPHPTSRDKQCTTCAECKHNVFGSARDGRGKACSTSTWIFLASRVFGKPPIAAVVAPPSSIKTLIGNAYNPGFFSRMMKKHSRYEIVWTTLTLARAAEGSKHCVIEPIEGPLCPDVETVKKIAKIRNQFMEAMEAMRSSAPEVVPQEGETAHEEGAAVA